MFLAYGLLASEREVADLLGANIAALASYADRFGHAVALTDYIDENRRNIELSLPLSGQFVSWKFIAVESGVIATYNAFECMRQIPKLYKKSETVVQTMDEALFLKAKEVFDRTFPAMDKSVRTGVAHGAPAHASLKEHKKHMPNGGPSINLLHGRTLQATLHGRMLEFTVDQEASKTLEEVAILVKSAFEGTREFTLRYNSACQYDKDNPVVVPQQ